MYSKTKTYNFALELDAVIRHTVSREIVPRAAQRSVMRQKG
jgi:hypothetical protein